MKKIYMIPVQRVITLETEEHLLAGSGNKDQFEVGLSHDEMNGSEALSDKKDLWGNEDVWK